MGVEQNEKTVILTTESGASAEIYLFGATVTSWKVDGQEKLFLSTKSQLDASKPVSPGAIPEIRGGVPICFPIFGPPPSEPADYAALSQHGFARSQNWTLEKVIMDRPEGVSVRFKAPSPPSDFEHKYKLAYVVTLSRHELSTDVHITNEETDKNFDFQCLLHTYLAVPDIKKIKILGLDKGIAYRDKTRDNKTFEWSGETLTIDAETDSVFHKIPSQELKLDYGTGSGVLVHFRGFEDATIWNPDVKKGQSMADMEDGGWERYVCIEPGYAREFKSLKPGEEFLGQQVLKAF